MSYLSKRGLTTVLTALVAGNGEKIGSMMAFEGIERMMMRGEKPSTIGGVRRQR